MSVAIEGKYIGPIHLLSFIFGITLFSCSKPADSVKGHHPIETYIGKIKGLHGLTTGKKVVIVVNTNGCHLCLDQVKELALNKENPDIKFIYSIENKRLADLDIVNASRKDTISLFMDYDHTPFRKGLVSDSPVVYFLSEGLMVDSVQLTPGIFNKTIRNAREFIGKY